MSTTKFQYKILKKCFALTVFFVKAFGFWLYKIDHRNRTIKYDFFRVIYSISLNIFFLYGYSTVGSDFVYSVNKKVFVSFAFQFIFFLHTNIILISFLLLYLSQYVLYGKRKFAFEKCRAVVEAVKCYQKMNVSHIRKYLLRFAIKAVAIELIMFGALWFNWLMLDALNSFAQFYLLAFTYLPLCIVRFHTTVFYGGILVIQVVLEQLNENLSNVLQQATHHQLHVKNAANDKFYRKLCDDVEKLSVLHGKLNEAAKAFNSIFTIQIVLSIISLIFLLVLRCFYLYVAVVDVITRKGFSGLYRCGFTCLVMILSSYDLYSTSAACVSVEIQVSKNNNKKNVRRTIFYC